VIAYFVPAASGPESATLTSPGPASSTLLLNAVGGMIGSVPLPLLDSEERLPTMAGLARFGANPPRPPKAALASYAAARRSSMREFAYKRTHGYESLRPDTEDWAKACAFPEGDGTARGRGLFQGEGAASSPWPQLPTG
jgi:hypothetical protein